MWDASFSLRPPCRFGLLGYDPVWSVVNTSV
jgi:hypothetical protein